MYTMNSNTKDAKMESNSIVKFENLHDNCILEIFKNLPIVDYFHMRKVCRRFDELIKKKSCYKEWCDHDMDNTLHENFEEKSFEKFKWFVGNMHDVAEKVEFCGLSEQHLKLLQKTQVVFPQVHTLKICIPDMERFWTKVASFEYIRFKALNVTAIISKAFCNVESLTYKDVLFDAAEFAEMPNLKKFELFNQNIPCNYKHYYNPHSLLDVFQLCQLTKIAIEWQTEDDIIDLVDEAIALCADTLEDLTITAELFSCNYRLPNLIQLTLIDNSVSNYNVNEGYFEILNIYDEYKKTIFFSNLDELRNFYPKLNKVYSADEEIRYFTLINGCKTAVDMHTFWLSLKENLKVFGVPLECAMYIDFELEVRDIVRRQPQRNAPLQMHCLVDESTSAERRAELLQILKRYERPQLIHYSIHDTPIRNYDLILEEFVNEIV